MSQRALRSFTIALFGLLALFHGIGDSTLVAQVSVPKFFSEHMVVQRNKEVVIWGKAAANQPVIVTFDKAKTETQADSDGHWKATLPAMKAGGPFKMTIGTNAAKPEIVWSDILVGEVWLCSGQSNMQWTVKASGDAANEIANAQHPMIRHIGVERKQSNVPTYDIGKGTWKVCTPENTGEFSAVAYYFARTLNKNLDVPIGVINSSWGGTRVEPWTPPVGFANVPALADISKKVTLWTAGTPERTEVLNKHVNATEKWLASAKQAIESGDGMVTASPTFPAGLVPGASHQEPTKLYNHMIHPLVGLPIQGAIWYQGESNHNEGMLYFEKKKALINGWRKLWGQGDFPFYFVQIAPYQYGNEDPTILARFWEAQTKVTEIPNTGMVVISDIGNLKNIHPANKQDVGARLAAFALKNDYGKDVIAGGPVFESMEVNGNELTLTFSNVGEGLKSNDGQPLSHFEIAGAKSGFKPATATIDGDKVVLKSAEVANPLAMRFAWHKLAEPNLVNSAGIPSSAFRAGEVPDELSLIPGFTDYKLIYDLDFSKLGARFAYQQDMRQSVGTFEKIAYCMETKKGNSPKQYVFVAMNAFTGDSGKIGVPTFKSKGMFRQNVGAIDVYSNVGGVKTGTGLPGYIEFWSNNYGPNNSARVAGASNELHDFGDTPSNPVDGYGCMQVHNLQAKQTVFAFNNWKAESGADLGIGNAPTGHRDWTFSKNLDEYSMKRLRVMVK